MWCVPDLGYITVDWSFFDYSESLSSDLDSICLGILSECSLAYSRKFSQDSGFEK